MRVKLFKRYAPRTKKKKGRRLITFKGEEGKLPRRIAIGVGALVLALLLANALRVEPSLMSSAEVATVHDHGVLRVGVRADMPKMGEEGAGFEVELGELLAERIMEYDENWSGERDAAELITVTPMTVGTKLDDGSIDVAIAMLPRNATSKYAYSGTYYIDTCRFAVREGEGARPIENLRIGYIQSASTTSVYVPTACFSARLTDYLSNHAEDGLITTHISGAEEVSNGYASFDEMFRALENGEVDAIVASDLYLDKYEGTYAFERSETVLGAFSYGVACSSDSSALASIADLILSEMQADGTLAALYAKYGLTAPAAE